MLDEAAIMESSTGDSCVVIMHVLSADLSASPQNEKQKKQKRSWRDTPLRDVDVMRLNLYLRVVANSFDGAIVDRCSR